MRTHYENALLCPAIPTRLTVGVAAFAGLRPAAGNSAAPCTLYLRKCAAMRECICRYSLCLPPDRVAWTPGDALSGDTASVQVDLLPMCRIAVGQLGVFQLFDTVVHKAFLFQFSDGAASEGEPSPCLSGIADSAVVESETFRSLCT